MVRPRSHRKDSYDSSGLEVHARRTNHTLNWPQFLAIVRYIQPHLRIELSNCAAAPTPTGANQTMDVAPILELYTIGQQIQGSLCDIAIYMTDNHIYDLVWQFHGS